MQVLDVASCMPSACAVTRYGPPTRSPVALNAPLALVVVDSVVPDGMCTIETRAPGIGWPFAPTTKPDRLLVVSCATATGHARIATMAAFIDATGKVTLPNFRIRSKFYSQALRVSAAFSAIMTVGALVLPPISVGITEASTTESPSMPRTRSAGSTTARCVVAHAAGPDRVIDRVRAPADLRDERFVRSPSSANSSAPAMRRKRRAFHDLARAPDARQQCREVRGLREEVRVDARRRRAGSAECRPTLPRLFGRSTATWQETP